MIASATLTIVVNSQTTRILRHCSWIMGVLFFVVWLYIGISLAVTAPHPQTAELRRSIALDFTDPSGWGSNIAVLVGILGPISTFVGGDVSCHMSEETEDASRSVPRAIYRSAAVGYSMTILTTVLIIYSLGPNPADLTSSPSGQPYQQVFYNATESKSKTIAMVFFMLLLLFFSQITTTTASSRQIFTFARDNGLPFSRYISEVSMKGLIHFMQLSDQLMHLDLHLDTHSMACRPVDSLHNLPAITHPARIRYRLQYHHIPLLHRYIRILLDHDRLHVL